MHFSMGSRERERERERGKNEYECRVMCVMALAHTVTVWLAVPYYLLGVQPPTPQPKKVFFMW